MKTIRISLFLLGTLSLLIPLGIAAQFAIAALRPGASSPSLLSAFSGFVPLIFGIAFIYLGVRMNSVVDKNPRLPLITLKAWVISTVLSALIFIMAGYRPNAVGLVIVALIYLGLSRAIKKEINEA